MASRSRGRRRSTRRARGYRRKKMGRSGYANDRVKGATAVMLNPFTNQSVIPRIPDGSVTFSTGFREQIARPLQGCVNTTYLLFTPGLCTNLLNTPPTQVPPLEANGEFALNSFFDDDLDPRNFRWVTTSGSVEKIRIVSAGLSLKCTSNASQNNGYFEAIRLPMANSIVEETVLPDLFCQHPSYVHGKLRDIESYSFQIKPCTSDIQWYNQNQMSFDPGVVPLNEMMNLRFSTFDSILIKIVAGTNPTDLFAHSVTNFEVVYDEDSELSKFMTTTPKDLAAVERVRSLLTSNMKAARSIYNAR